MSSKKTKNKLGKFSWFRRSTTDLSEWNEHDAKLLKAVENGDLSKMSKVLKSKKVQPSKLGPKGLSVFHVACSQGQLPVVDLLLSYGAEVNTLSIQGITGVQIAAKDGWPEVLKKLLVAGGVVDHKDAQNLTALHHACSRGQLECVQVLLNHDADPNSKDKTGKPPLFYAAYADYLAICNELVDNGANPNACDQQQVTPLMAAAKKGHTEVCQFLLKRGALADAKDGSGQTALAYALKEGHTSLQEVFHKAPTRASWDVQPSSAAQKEMQAEEVTDEVDSSSLDNEQQDNSTMVSTFVAANTPEIERKSIGESEEDHREEEIRAQKAASPPQSVIEQRTLEAYRKGGHFPKELEEENEHMNVEVKKLTLENRRLMQTVETLRSSQLSSEPQLTDEEIHELEDEITNLRKQLEEERERSRTLEKKMEKSQKAVENHRPSIDKGERQDTIESDASWAESDDDEDKSVRSSISNNKPQTFMLLQNQVKTLRQENKELKERFKEQLIDAPPRDSDVEKLQLKIRLLEEEKQLLSEQIREDNVFETENNKSTDFEFLEMENQELQKEVEQLKAEIHSLKVCQTLANGDLSDSDFVKQDSRELPVHKTEILKQNSLPVNLIAASEESRLRLEIDDLRRENTLLTQELETLRNTYSKLVIAGDNLQDMYDQLLSEKEQLHEEFEKALQEKEELVKENEYLLSDGNAMHDDIEKLVQEVEKLQEKTRVVTSQNAELEHKLAATNISGKASEVARLVEERNKLKEKVEELEPIHEQLKHDNEIVMEELQSVQERCDNLQEERDQLQEEYNSLQDECEQIQQQFEGLQQDYTQLESDFTELMETKDTLEQDLLDVQTGSSVQVEQQNPVLQEEKEHLQQENGTLVMEKEQLELTIEELSRANALLNEQISALQVKVTHLEQMTSGKVSELIEGVERKDSKLEANSEISQAVDNSKNVDLETEKEKDRRIRSLQIQISRLQQQLAESDTHYRDVINTYRTHLLSAVQGHMDPDVRQALYNIIELRSMEQFC